ncbi:hypothetical protein CQW23_04618 [Capsicum baccatum]|uniref:Uncharacterized protein n=1 Tax=Capsicum baccatum TaxID=33114 RepID=A0A2G2XF54_CAPBA|nr:hypothetical protein CQW23_04618 [Capsicum baccatum]
MSFVLDVLVWNLSNFVCVLGFLVFHINSESVKKLVIWGYWHQEDEDSDDDDDDDKELTIWARNVTSLEISGWFHKKIPVLQNVQALVDAKLYFFEFRTNQKMLNDLLVLLGYVEKLSIGPWSLQNNLGFKEDSNDPTGENYWMSSPCWGFRLKTLRIYGTWIYANCYFEQIMPFMEAVLKNGIVLEKIILTPFKDGI